jgi:hypothetical protein
LATLIIRAAAGQHITNGAAPTPLPVATGIGKG